MTDNIFLRDLIAICIDDRCSTKVYELIQEHYSWDDIVAATRQVFIADICKYSALNSKYMNNFIYIPEFIGIATDNYNRLSKNNISDILHIIKDNECEQGKQFISKLHIRNIARYIWIHRTAIQFITKYIDIRQIANDLKNIKDIRIIVKYDPRLACTLYHYCSTLSRTAIVDSAVQVLLNGNNGPDILYLVMDGMRKLIDTKNVKLLIEIFWAIDNVMYNHKMGYIDYYCPISALLEHLNNYKEFRDQYYKITCLQKYTVPVPKYATGIIAGLLTEDIYIITKAIDNIKSNTDILNDDLEITIPTSLLNKCSYELLLKTYTYIKKVGIINNVDSETIHNIEYILANEECSICFSKTTNIFIPPRINENIHKCSTIYCNNCYQQLGPVCSVCKKQFVCDDDDDEDDDNDNDNDDEDDDNDNDNDDEDDDNDDEDNDNADDNDDNSGRSIDTTTIGEDTDSDTDSNYTGLFC